MSASNLTFAQTYTLASRVRSKLTKEAASPKSSLRNLVVQANMLDNLMDYISVETKKRSAASKVHTSTSVHFELPAARHDKTSISEYEVNSDSDSDSDSDDDDVDADYVPRSFNNIHYEEEFDSDSDSDEDSDDDYYYSDSDDAIIDDDAEELEFVTTTSIPRQISTTSFKELPSIDLSMNLVPEEDEEDEDDLMVSPTDEVPGLCRTVSLTDDEEDEVNDQHHRNYVHTNVEHHDSSHTKTHSGSVSVAAPPSLFKHVVPTPTSSLHQRNNAIYSMEHMF